MDATDVGRHNATLAESAARIGRAAAYRNSRIIAFTPTRGMIPARVSFAWRGLMPPMNHAFHWFHIEGQEVAAAYNAGVEAVIGNPAFADWKYFLTVEEDNLPPPDGILKLLETIEGLPEEFAAVGGLYWTKGDAGQPMIYGNPTSKPMDFVPQPPIPNAVQECNGLGMGFTLFKLSVFRDQRLERPWFKTEQRYTPGEGAKAYTQDLYFFERVRKLGYRVASDNRVLVGHLDPQTGVVW
jgi:hypothetical protein